MQHAWTMLRRLLRAEHGQDLVEYGLLAALIAVVAMTAVTALGTAARNALWNTVVNNL